ncbi:MAG: metallophosphoesterase, partial [Pseudomonadota bacterium]|nr:metallophosphoesterase [Pseudomonadota bacterium]
MNDTLTFAQLSDPHMSSLEDVKWRDLTNKRLLGYLSWRRRRRAEHRSEVLDALQRDLEQVHPEHLVITGDLTHIGLPNEFRQARRWLESLGGPRGVTVVPGNHDAYIQVPWQQSFLHWQPYMVSDMVPDGGQGNSADTVFPSLRHRGPVAFIGLSSARPSAPFFATGRLGDRQLQRLEELLAQTGRQGLFRVVLLHHPPVPGEEKWRKRLTDAAEVCKVIARRGAELVLHGHRHRAVQSRIEIPGTHVPVFGIPSASSIGYKPGRIAQYYVYTVRQ